MLIQESCFAGRKQSLCLSDSISISISLTFIRGLDFKYSTLPLKQILKATLHLCKVPKYSYLNFPVELFVILGKI